MPGILGIINSEPFKQDMSATLDRMAEPLRYAPDQTVQRFERDRFAGAVVDYGPRFPFLKPAIAERDRVLLLMDGEVFPDASEVPHELQGNSPTVQRAEYCLHLYLERGPKFVTSLNGTFGIAVYDQRDHTVHLYNDRFGHNLLFLWMKDDECAFASSVRSLLRFRTDIGREYDKRGVAELMALERILDNRTLFCDISRMQSGRHATWDGKHWRIERYTTVPDNHNPRTIDTWSDAAEELLRVLRNSLRKRMSDKASAAVMLSGGADSRLVLATCPDRVVAATIADRDHPMSRETRTAMAVSRLVGIPHILLERNDINYYASIAELATEINEGVSTWVSSHSVGVHDQLADAGIEVVLTGDRFDTWYKGYWTQPPIRPGLYGIAPEVYHARRCARMLVDMSSLFRRVDRLDLIMLALNDELKDFISIAREEMIRGIQSYWQEHISFGELTKYVLLAEPEWPGFTNLGFLRGLGTRFLDRSPAFDNDMLSLAWTLPMTWQLRGRVVRRAIKKANAELARIIDCSTGLPVGLCAPWDKWIGAIREIAKHIIKPMLTRSHLYRRHSNGSSVITSSSWHDLNAALRRSPAYRTLVQEAIEGLDPAFFDVEVVKELYQSEVNSSAPKLRSLFEMVLTFTLFDKKWGPQAR